MCAQKREHKYVGVNLHAYTVCVCDVSMSCVSSTEEHLFMVCYTPFNALLESSTTALQRPIWLCNSNITVVMNYYFFYHLNYIL